MAEVTRADLRRAFWRSGFIMSSINYERFQALGFLYGMLPILRKLYPSHERLKAALKRHMEMFNSNPLLVPPIQGVVIALEERNAREEADNAELVGSINSVKVGLMGPFAGIGDSILWGTIRPILGGLAAGLALRGSIVGPLLYLVLWNVVNVGLRWYGLVYGYQAGLDIVRAVRESDIVRRVAEGASVVGLMVLGALVASWVNVKTPLALTAGKQVIKIQDVLDGIMPSMLPLAVTFIAVWLLRRRIRPDVVLAVLFVGAFVLGAVGILGS